MKVSGCTLSALYKSTYEDESTHENGQSASENVSKGARKGSSEKRACSSVSRCLRHGRRFDPLVHTPCEDGHNRADLRSGSIESVDPVLRTDGASDHAQIISVQNRAERSEDGHEELCWVSDDRNCIIIVGMLRWPYLADQPRGIGPAKHPRPDAYYR